MRLLYTLLLSTTAAFLFTGPVGRAQDGPNVTLTDSPPPRGWEQVINYTGNNATSICYSPSTLTTGLRAATRVSISAATNASPVVFTSTGHGFALSARPQVTVSGATGGWTGVNGTRTATVIDANTFSIPVDSTGFGALTGTVVFTTTAPRSAQPEWAVKIITYDGSNNAIWIGWLNGTAAVNQKCSEAATATVVQQ